MLAAASSAQTPNFILPNGTIVIEVILFVVVIGLVNALVLKPVQRVINEREANIRASQSTSEDATREAASLEAERRRVLDAARSEARVLLEQAARTVDERRLAAQESGLAEHDRLLGAAVSEIDGERAGVRTEVLARAEGLVVDAASRIVGVEIDPTRHHDLIAATIASAASGEVA